GLRSFEFSKHPTGTALAYLFREVALLASGLASASPRAAVASVQDPASQRESAVSQQFIGGILQQEEEVSQRKGDGRFRDDRGRGILVSLGKFDEVFSLSPQLPSSPRRVRRIDATPPPRKRRDGADVSSCSNAGDIRLTSFGSMLKLIEDVSSLASETIRDLLSKLLILQITRTGTQGSDVELIGDRRGYSCFARPFDRVRWEVEDGGRYEDLARRAGF
ncbi:hypothetical protein SCHPADRAFT_897048, partial [Schizopora paradoxa]